VSGRTVGHPGLDRVAAAAARYAESASRERQLWWVAGELARALEHPAFPLPADALVEDLFELEATTAYLALGAAGELRVRASAKKPGVDVLHSTRMRRTVLTLLAEQLGLDPDLPRRPPLPPAKTPVPPRPREQLREALADLQERSLGGESVARLRMLAIGGMVADTGARSGELVDQDLNDLHPGLAAARVRRRPQGSTADGPTSVDAVALLRQSSTAMAAWLRVRARIIAPAADDPRDRTRATALTGSAWALWVSIRSNHGEIRRDGSAAPRPAGTPLGARGLAYAWNDAVATVNEQLAGEPGWTPLPARMDQLRRGVQPTGFLAPSEPPLYPDAERAVELLDRLAEHARALAAVLAQADADGNELRACRRRLRSCQDWVWFEGIDHRTTLRTLQEAGLMGGALAQAGWHPALLSSLDLAHRYGRAVKPAHTA